ncbi:hypothetical protein [Iodidimonas sp. SYSU 1G8]|uniref:hypothetical protein n=1 Tax=Iodidimonas sp. SYSU 1G8 TaxID=3133967 RepID=UPI0031FE6222
MKFETRRPKSRFAVQIELQGMHAGDPLRGNVFLDHGDILEDVIDSDAAFLVFEDESGSMQLIQKTHIKRIVSLKDERIGLLVQERREEPVAIVIGGEKRTGRLLLTTYQRVSDHMNKGGMFTAFAPDGESLEFINKSIIDRVILTPKE